MEGKKPFRASGPEELLGNYYGAEVKAVETPPLPPGIAGPGRRTNVFRYGELLPRLICAAALALCLLSPLALKSYKPAFARHFADIYASRELEKPVTAGLMSVSRFLNTYLMN